MKPLAKLYLNRQRLYEKTCDDAGEKNVDTGVISKEFSKMFKRNSKYHFVFNRSFFSPFPLKRVRGGQWTCGNKHSKS